MSKPAISVLMPVYNAKQYLAEAINSILAQSFTNFEFFIVDDCSTDGSTEIITEYAKKDTRIHVFRNTVNAGIVHSLNYGLKQCRAPLVARMDADDISVPNRLATQIEVIQQDDSLVALGGAIRCIDENGMPFGHVIRFPLEHDQLLKFMPWGSVFAHPAVIYRKEAVCDAGGYRSDFMYCEDYDLWLRLIKYGKIGNLNAILLNYRIHKNNTSVIHAAIQRRRMMYAQADNWYAQEINLSSFFTNGCIDPAHLQGTEKVIVSLLARGLASYSHILGDTSEDAEGSMWLQYIRRFPLTKETRYALALYHLRCLRRYLHLKRLGKSSVHFLSSLNYSLRPHMRMLKKMFGLPFNVSI